jgi:hypothetical protein
MPSPRRRNELHHFGWNACSSALCHTGHGDHGQPLVQMAAEGKGVSDGFTSYKAFVGDPPRTRWGDYGAAVADGSSIWIASEYINQSCTLTEWFANAGPQLGSCGGTRTALANWATRFSEIRP